MRASPAGDDALRRALGYRRFCGPPRLLIFDGGYLVVRDAAEAAEDLGWAVRRLAIPAGRIGSSAFVRSLLEELVAHRPDFILTINHLGFDQEGVLAALLARYHLPVASWFVDHPVPVLAGTKDDARANTQVFSFERTSLPWLRRQGFLEPVYLPTGSNGRYFDAGAVAKRASDELRGKLTFAGNSWWTKARVEPSPSLQAEARALAARARLDRNSLANGLADRLERICPGGARTGAEILQVALAEASLKRRQQFACELAPQGLRVHGDPYWRELAPGLQLCDFLRYETELPALFMGSEINANVTAVQMPTAVNQRVWDIPAVGGFLITDAQEDALEHFVAGEEIVTYGDFGEAREKILYYGGRPAARERIARAGQARVLAAHRFTHRLAKIGEVMRRRFS